MTSSQRRIAIIVGLLTGLMLPATALASRQVPLQARSRAPVVLHQRFVMRGTGYTGVIADQVNILEIHQDTANPGAGATQPTTLVDDATGAQASISQPQCSSPVLGGPWLLFTACPDEQLYPLTGGTPLAEQRPPGYAVPVAVGSHWIEYNVNCDGVHACITYAFQNIQTGAVVDDPTSTHTIASLASPGLARRVCAPLLIPNATFLGPTQRLVPDGRFAITQGSTETFIRRCGTRRRWKFTATEYNDFSATTHTIAWINGTHVAGIFLPSMRRSSITTPFTSATEPQAIALGPKTLYIVDDIGSSGRPRRPAPPDVMPACRRGRAISSPLRAMPRRGFHASPFVGEPVAIRRTGRQTPLRAKATTRPRLPDTDEPRPRNSGWIIGRPGRPLRGSGSVPTGVAEPKDKRTVVRTLRAALLANRGSRARPAKKTVQPGHAGTSFRSRSARIAPLR